MRTALLIIATLFLTGCTIHVKPEQERVIRHEIRMPFYRQTIEERRDRHDHVRGRNIDINIGPNCDRDRRNPHRRGIDIDVDINGNRNRNNRPCR